MQLSDYLAKVARGLKLTEGEIMDMGHMADDAQTMSTLFRSFVRTGTQQLSLRLPFDVIQSSVLEADVANVVIQVPSDFKHLIMLCAGQSANASYNDTLNAQFNGDTGANYHQDDIYGYNTTVTQSDFTGLTSVAIASFEGTLSPANSAAGRFIFFSHYGSKFWKSIYSFGGMENDNLNKQSASLSAHYWKNTSPIQSISLTLVSGANMKAGSLISLYGLR